MGKVLREKAQRRAVQCGAVLCCAGGEVGGGLVRERVLTGRRRSAASTRFGWAWRHGRHGDEKGHGPWSGAERKERRIAPRPQRRQCTQYMTLCPICCGATPCIACILYRTPIYARPFLSV